MTTNPTTRTHTSELTYKAWNEDKTRRVNQHDDKHYPSANPCPYCNGSGWRYVDWNAGKMEPCSCREGMRIAGNKKRAGRSASIAKYKLKDFNAGEEWQRTLLKAAVDYAKKPEGFLYICGQPGAGKTHLTAGAFNHILSKGNVGMYRDWTSLTSELKAVQNTPDYVNLMNSLKGCAILFIDDFLHAPKKNPSTGDLKIAFEIVKCRLDDNKPTIISSNLTTGDIDKFDDSLSGRLAEAAGRYLLEIGKDPHKNYRARGKINV